MVKAAARPSLPQRIQGTPDAGTETILLVEDEPMVRDLVKSILQANGYLVLEAEQGLEAIRMVEQHAEPIHLLLTDVILPDGMSGRDIAQHVTSLYPDLKVLYMSGYTDNAIMEHGVLDPEVNFLQKPFHSVDLLYKVREVLDLV
jgi:CheY-like chemotaxis protein